jgi:dolichol-phosphate mannosyltransferase
MKKYKLGIVTPTYKEKGNIAELVQRTHDACVKAGIKAVHLIMDDNSPDGTADEIRDWISKINDENYELRIHVRPGKMGLASAYTQGFEMIKDEAEYLLSMDADLSHKPEYIGELLSKAAEGYDLVIGSRNIPGGSVKGWKMLRILISRNGSRYTRTLLGVKIYDFTGGYNLYKTEIFDKLDLNTIKAQGYLFQIEMKYTVAKLGFKFAEIPIEFPDRTHGHSKISKKIIIEAFLGVPKLRFKKIIS